MKKLLLLPFIVLFFAACSVDESAGAQGQEANLLITESDNNDLNRFSAGKCFKSLSAHVDVDLSGGLNNPVLYFTSEPPAGVPFAEQYRVSVELQPLADCEDVNNHLGNSLLYTSLTPFYNISVNSPAVQVVPSQLPNTCYKWRIVLERVTDTQRISSCISVSDWYDMPLY